MSNTLGNFETITLGQFNNYVPLLRVGEGWSFVTRRYENEGFLSSFPISSRHSDAILWSSLHSSGICWRSKRRLRSHLCTIYIFVWPYLDHLCSCCSLLMPSCSSAGYILSSRQVLILCLSISNLLSLYSRTLWLLLCHCSAPRSVLHSSSVLHL